MNDNDIPAGSVTLQLSKDDLEAIDFVADQYQLTRERAIMFALNDWLIGQGRRRIPPTGRNFDA